MQLSNFIKPRERKVDKQTTIRQPTSHVPSTVPVRSASLEKQEPTRTMTRQKLNCFASFTVYLKNSFHMGSIAIIRKQKGEKTVVPSITVVRARGYRLNTQIGVGFSPDDTMPRWHTNAVYLLSREAIS